MRNHLVAFSPSITVQVLTRNQSVCFQEPRHEPLSAEPRPRRGPRRGCMRHSRHRRGSAAGGPAIATSRPKVGGTLRFRFGPHRKAMRIARLDPDREVRWICTEAHIEFAQFTRKDEWVGTEIVFHLSPHEGGRARLGLRAHRPRARVRMLGQCAPTGWRHFLGSPAAVHWHRPRGTPFEPAATRGCTLIRTLRRSHPMSTTSDTDRIEQHHHHPGPARTRLARPSRMPRPSAPGSVPSWRAKPSNPGSARAGRSPSAATSRFWFDVVVERMEPPDLFSFRWHPYPVDSGGGTIQRRSRRS